MLKPYLVDHKDPLTEEIDCQLWEQHEYLRGVLYADPELRLNENLNDVIGDWIDTYTGGSKAFWRGLLETCATISLYATNDGQHARPQIILKGSYGLLKKFLEFLEEQLGHRGPRVGVWQPKWDTDGKLLDQCAIRKLKFSGVQARDVIFATYTGQEIGPLSKRQTADRILAWTPRR